MVSNKLNSLRTLLSETPLPAGRQVCERNLKHISKENFAPFVIKTF